MTIIQEIAPIFTSIRNYNKVISRQTIPRLPIPKIHPVPLPYPIAKIIDGHEVFVQAVFEFTIPEKRIRAGVRLRSEENWKAKKEDGKKAHGGLGLVFVKCQIYEKYNEVANLHS